MEQLIEIGFVVWILIMIISVIYVIADHATRPERFRNKMNELRSLGYKIKYYNQTTGTISYTDKNGRRSSVSVYRGYNSHYRG